jgi:two-component sensor histidine kinase
MNVNVEEVMLDVNTAIPLGLILTELISNCLKYAFLKIKAEK